ncbi:unnamed protein product [Prorocentrum cordatum]|uniref:3'-5' exonuclease domain-containing protein n=1 Tax=Prorocentrum cordatum TaxID=2364126 RepID=A0ABN9UBG7_9DINO|nr:unnamed protein product [Polarella glacialis]
MYRFMNVSGQGQTERSENYHRFQGQTIVVDLADVNGETEDFPGRHWLEGITRDNKPVGWDLEWQPDRTKETDNPIALMQFADDKVALLLRTHRTRNWLPVSVMRTLLSESCKKVQVGWDGPDRQKMQSTFNFLPLGILDMSELAKVKGVAAQGLKSLSEHFGMKMKKDSRIARSNWADKELTEQQRCIRGRGRVLLLRGVPEAERPARRPARQRPGPVQEGRQPRRAGAAARLGGARRREPTTTPTSSRRGGSTTSDAWGGGCARLRTP